MNAEAKALLQGVVEHPDDVARRRVFADWLVERNDPLGHFIQVQCELVQLESGSSARRSELEHLEKQLLERYGEHWRKEMPSGAVVFRGGFVEEWRCTADAYIRHAARVMVKVPLRRLILERVSAGQLQHLLSKVPEFLTVRELEFRSQFYWPYALLAEADFRRLEHLVVSGDHSNNDSVQPLLSAKWWPTLCSAQLMMTLGLEELCASESSLTSIVALAARAPAHGNHWHSVFDRMPQLRTLVLTLTHDSVAFVPPSSLESLTLRRARLTSAVVEGLVGSTLKHCSIVDCTVDDGVLVERLIQRFNSPFVVAGK